MRKQKFKTIIASILACSMAATFTSCGTKEASAPELLSPVSGMDSYREVCYGDVGTMEICFGTIVPTQYAHFWTTNVTIDEIKVDVGDYVHAGICRKRKTCRNWNSNRKVFWQSGKWMRHRK